MPKEPTSGKPTTRHFRKKIRSPRCGHSAEFGVTQGTVKLVATLLGGVIVALFSTLFCPILTSKEI